MSPLELAEILLELNRLHPEAQVVDMLLDPVEHAEFDSFENAVILK